MKISLICVVSLIIYPQYICRQFNYAANDKNLIGSNPANQICRQVNYAGNAKKAAANAKIA